MKEPKKSLKDLKIDKSWTLFLDRDGVINRKIENGYVLNWSMFDFLPGVIDALKILRAIFGRIIIVTNQRCIAKGLISHEDLNHIHKKMCEVLEIHGIRIDGVYYCPHDIDENCNCRKPKPGLIYKALKDFPYINLSKSIIAGDSKSDIEAGINANIYTLLIGETDSESNADFIFRNLYDFSMYLLERRSSQNERT